MLRRIAERRETERERRALLRISAARRRGIVGAMTAEADWIQFKWEAFCTAALEKLFKQLGGRGGGGKGGGKRGGKGGGGGGRAAGGAWRTLGGGRWEVGVGGERRRGGKGGGEGGGARGMKRIATLKNRKMASLFLSFFLSFSLSLSLSVSFFQSFFLSFFLSFFTFTLFFSFDYCRFFFNEPWRRDAILRSGARRQQHDENNNKNKNNKKKREKKWAK